MLRTCQKQPSQHRRDALVGVPRRGRRPCTVQPKLLSSRKAALEAKPFPRGKKGRETLRSPVAAVPVLFGVPGWRRRLRPWTGAGRQHTEEAETGATGSPRLSPKRRSERESAQARCAVAIARLVVGPNRGVVLFVGDGGNSAAQVSGTPVRQP